MTHPYTQAEYDAFGWSPLSRAELLPAETYGLDYESARNATPRWYGVSFGNGNDGVSHLYPDYYCRVPPSAAYDLATVAMIANFNRDDGKAYAVESMQIDGEADYTISAMIYDPPDEGSGDRPEDGEDAASWSEANGAWVICEVFPADDDDASYQASATMVCDRPAYSSLAECFDTADLELAAKM